MNPARDNSQDSGDPTPPAQHHEIHDTIMMPPEEVLAHMEASLADPAAQKAPEPETDPELIEGMMALTDYSEGLVTDTVVTTPPSYAVSSQPTDVAPKGGRKRKSTTAKLDLGGDPATRETAGAARPPEAFVDEETDKTVMISPEAYTETIHISGGGVPAMPPEPDPGILMDTIVQPPDPKFLKQDAPSSSGRRRPTLSPAPGRMAPPSPPRGEEERGGKRIDPMVVLDRMGILLQLQRRARTAVREEIPFIMVNESRQLVPYRQSALFTIQRKRPNLAAMSGLAVPDKNTPYAEWLRKFVAWRLGSEESAGTTLARIDLVKLIKESKKPPKWLSDWKDWVPSHLVWAPLTGGGRLLGVLLFFRADPFNESEKMFATHLADSYSQAMALSQVKKFRADQGAFPWVPIIIAAILACMFIPVRQSVLAPAEMAARRPALVRSGLDGVVERILVEPNQRVREGEPLVRLDDTQLRTRLAVAEKAEDMAATEYNQLVQAGLSDPKAKQQLPLVQGRMEQLSTETEYIRSLMERVIITSPADGIALCDNPDEWLGRPVSLGQRILLVADPDDLELEIRLPATESLQLEPGDEVTFFPNIAPIAPVTARLTFVGYRAGEVPGVGMAYTLRASPDIRAKEGEPPILGLRGTAKLYGPRTPLGLNLLRKPIAAVRQWLGR